MNVDFWQGKRVLVTGHTGFKGSWLCLLLERLGAIVIGYSRKPESQPNLYDMACVEKGITSIIGELSDDELLQSSFAKYKPEIVFHLAAQALVIESYHTPKQTYETNVIGTLNVLEACRRADSVRSIVLVSTDKCYENQEWSWGYRESDRLGGYDPYSSSKACMEILASSYRSSFFPPEQYTKHNVALATVRAGNVIGGGDFSENRIIPDILNAIKNKTKISLRNPTAVRPWQHVLEPLYGYLKVAEKMAVDGSEYVHAWNFGPDKDATRTVNWITEFIVQNYPSEVEVVQEGEVVLHEAQLLALDCSLANSKLKWYPRWTIEKALRSIIEWSQHVESGDSARDICLQQITDYRMNEERNH